MHGAPRADRPTTAKRRDIMIAHLPKVASTKVNNSSLVKAIKRSTDEMISGRFGVARVSASGHRGAEEGQSAAPVPNPGLEQIARRMSPRA
jgi:hypothetical protein